MVPPRRNWKEKRKRKRKGGGVEPPLNPRSHNLLFTRTRDLSQIRQSYQVIGIHSMASPEAIFSVLAMVLKEPKMPLQSAKHRITKNPKPIPDNSHNGCYCSSWKTTEIGSHFEVYSVIIHQGISLSPIQLMGNAAPNHPPSHQPPPQAQPAQFLFYSPAKTEVSPATLDGIRHPK